MFSNTNLRLYNVSLLGRIHSNMSVTVFNLHIQQLLRYLARLKDAGKSLNLLQWRCIFDGITDFLQISGTGAGNYEEKWYFRVNNQCWNCAQISSTLPCAVAVSATAVLAFCLAFLDTSLSISLPGLLLKNSMASSRSFLLILRKSNSRKCWNLYGHSLMTEDVLSFVREQQLTHLKTTYSR